LEEGDEIEAGKHKLHNLNVMWQLLEMAHAQPSGPEGLVLFRQTCLRQAARAC